MRNYLFIIVSLFGVQSLYSQSTYQHINSADSLRAAVSYHDAGEYEKALACYQMIHEGDTNYLTARYEEILTYSSLEKYDTVISLTEEFLKKKYRGHNGSYAQLGSAYDLLENSGKAIEVYKKGIELYPMDANLYFNLAVTYKNLDSLDLAVENFKNALIANPFHASSNLYLGGICASENELAMAMMCYDIFLMIEPATDRALEVLNAVNTMLKENFHGDAQNVKLKAKGEDNFDDINLIIKNRVALQEKYKTPNKLTLPIVKQNYALIESLKGREGKGFWNEYYVPFFQQIHKEEKFNDFMYYILLASSNDYIVKVLEKNIKKINEFPSWAGATWVALHEGYTEKVNGKDQFVYYLIDEGRVYAKGIAEDNMKIGKWQYFHTNGANSAIGNYKEDKKNGKWNYYYSTLGLSGTEIYEMDSVVGEDMAYYQDGSLMSLNTYVNGSLEGLSNSFNKNASPSDKTNFKNGKLDGEAEYYYNNGSVHYKVNYKEGELDGDFKELYPSGEISASSTFKEGKRVGPAISYFLSGEIEGKVDYVDGKKDGVYQNFYADGTLKEEGSYTNGVLNGPYKEYHPNGNIEAEGNYDENGKENGIYKQYAKNGKLNLELTFKKGEIIAYNNYNEAGEIVKGEKKSGGRFYYQNLYFNGNKRAEGNYEVGDGGKHGIWKFYNRNGTMNMEESHDYGRLNGELKEYFENGVLSYVTNYEQGDKEGLYLSYYKDGSLEEEGWHANDLKTDDWHSYYPDGVKSKHLFYVKGDLNGPQYYYDINGNLDHVEYYDMDLFSRYIAYDSLGNALQDFEINNEESEYSIVDVQGKKARSFNLKYTNFEGKTTYYFSDGSISSTGSYFNDRRNGEWITYHNNGKKSSEGQYLNGKKVGAWKYYFEDESIKKFIEYNQRGQLHGKYITYHDNGQESYHSEFNKGYNEEAYYYSPDGDLQHVRYFDEGYIIGYSHEGPDGNILKMIPIKDETGEVTSSYSNGNVSKQFQWENGMMTGSYNEYYKDGTLFEKMNFVDGEYVGNKESFHKNGKIKVRIPYVKGYKHGKEKHYSESGVLLKEIKYHYDDKHGYSKYYDESGKLIKTEYYYENAVIIRE